MDKILPISIISKAVVVDVLRVPYQKCQYTPVMDSRATLHSPIGRVELRWYKKDGAKSFDESFLVVDSSVPLVKLGATAYLKATAPVVPEVDTLGLQKQTAGKA